MAAAYPYSAPVHPAPHHAQVASSGESTCSMLSACSCASKGKKDSSSHHHRAKICKLRRSVDLDAPSSLTAPSSSSPASFPCSTKDAKDAKDGCVVLLMFMPTTSDRQLLLQNVLLVAESDMDQYMDEERLNEDDDEMDLDRRSIDSGEDSSATSDTSSTSSASSTSSSSSSDSSRSDDSMPAWADEISDDDEDEVYAARLSAEGALLNAILATRVLNPHTVPKVSQLHLVLVEFKENDPKRFRRNLRVLPETFDELVTRIEDHPVFFNNSRHPQTPVYIQLAIALYRFGHHGNAASVESIAQWAGISVGLVVKCTHRIIIAFYEVIRWPTEAEKEEAKDWVEAVSCRDWRGGFCMVDGTLVPLFEKPGHYGEAYFDRKSNYSLNVQLITLPNLRIIDYVIGHCGSAHDSTAFADARTYKERDTLFKKDGEDREWMWADSAYGLDWWCVTPYKRPASLQPNNKTFNYHLSRVRVKSEHSVGYVKGRFSSLRGLRQQIDSSIAHERALAWVKACLVIHTLVGFIESGKEDEEFLEEDLECGKVKEY
ncbi:DDE Tnp4 domain-containing protein [Mycena venus]|uniref:DDE Tnp4 domain-containing protein n=1 Tax=Mycena venus TaxID=2733690 RepID=A0A8H6U276_9AGAR|nr:DDE Tnp4 domain-containing protein [Mycena venus]